ncbi:hypothetical protein Agabi119p4_2583 [Agaricus bisporus var. burnettii]|uniref:Uncharacterized protein n=1 Tax=Agaricus bisporus var. burnettii TaxID=192524 RepID=A0A8H7F9J1_AGABI|nr:hypothetical protein Agabi119p4_2583 [Agaricus bisporus var. burnettii]
MYHSVVVGYPSSRKMKPSDDLSIPWAHSNDICLQAYIYYGSKALFSSLAASESYYATNVSSNISIA